MPQPAPVEAQEPPRKRLEDMPEFQKLAPEQQEYLLGVRERMMAEAMNPERVVTRSIGEMGFWEGMKETLKPHMAKAKEIAFKELKANASLALSLVPVLGEGKGLGTGLFGVTVKAGAPVEKAITFEPFVRLGKAGQHLKTGFESGRTVNEIVKYSPVAHEAADLVAHVRPDKAFKPAGRVKEIWYRAGTKARDIFSTVGASLHAKNTALGSLSADFSHSASEGATVIAKRFGVQGIREAQHAKAAAKSAAFAAEKMKVAVKNAGSREWWKFPVRWARSVGGEVRANVASMKAGKKAGEAVTIAVEATIPGYHHGVARVLERGVKQAAPTAIEATRFGKFHAFFDKWLNLTPDVPVWLSTTTGVLEFLGAHGVDAVPAVMQMAVNRYQQVKLSMDAAKDVMAYTTGRILQKVAERQMAAQTFAGAPMPMAA